jgi:hypothetical protein
MLYPILKALLSGLLIMAVSEIARRSTAFGALIVSLPLIAIFAIVWLWNDTGDTERVAAYAQATFWYVLPSLPMFLIFPALLRHGVGFWPSLAMSCAVTVVLYLAAIWVAARFGVRP